MNRNIIYVIPGNREIVKAEEKSIHKSTKFMLILAQCFGLFPVEGVLSSNAEDLKFRWKSWKTFYSILFAFSVLVITILQLILVFQEGFYFLDMGPIVFNVSILCSIMLFIKLSMKWPNLIKRWIYVDASFKSYGWPPNLDIRLKTMTSIVLLVALAEFILTTVNRWVVAHYKCDGKNSKLGLFEQFVKSTAYGDVLKIMQYTTFFGIFSQIVRLLSNFAWSYTDLFISLISTPIALRFRQLCMHVEDSIKRKVNSIDFWKNIREDYNKLCILTGILDENISSITLLSFITNLYFILTQLFNTLRYREEVLLKAYYYVSFFLLILRTVFVALYGAWINDETKNFCYTLHKAPACVYNSEISRLIDQTHFTEVALTGMNFFYVTRGIVLSMAGAIVTYELALIQFNESILHTNAEFNVTC